MGKSTRVAYGEALTHFAKTNEKIVVFDADLSNATQTKIFKKEFPNRFFNMGISEADMICEATAFAHTGLIPFASTFAVFGTGRAFEQIRNSACYTNANIKLAFTHSGLAVGEDGGSHQCIEDIALMRALPNMTIICPCDEKETWKAVESAINIEGPVYLRLGRSDAVDVTSIETEFKVGKANVLKEGNDFCIITYGLMVNESLEAAKLLEEKGISTAVINMHTIKPLDKDIILKYASKCKKMITVEEHTIYGGLGSAVAEVLSQNQINKDLKFKIIGIEDKFGQSGAPKVLFEEYGLTKENIIKNLL